MKKLTAVITTFAMTLFIFVGCGESASASKTTINSTNTPSPTETITANMPEIVEPLIAEPINVTPLDEELTDVTPLVEEFADETENIELGYIHNFDVENSSLDFDVIEWVTKDDTDRIKELNLNPDNDLPSGFYINNPDMTTKSYKMNEKTEYEIIDWDKNGELSSVNVNEFLEHKSKFTDYAPPFWIVINGESIISIKEQYTP